MTDLHRIQDIDLYIVAAAICFSNGGVVMGSAMLGCVVFIWIMGNYAKNLKGKK
jgi:hypothetical protein